MIIMRRSHSVNTTNCLWTGVADSIGTHGHVSQRLVAEEAYEIAAEEGMFTADTVAHGNYARPGDAGLHDLSHDHRGASSCGRDPFICFRSVELVALESRFRNCEQSISINLLQPVRRKAS